MLATKGIRGIYLPELPRRGVNAGTAASDVCQTEPARRGNVEMLVLFQVLRALLAVLFGFFERVRRQLSNRGVL